MIIEFASGYMCAIENMLMLDHTRTGEAENMIVEYGDSNELLEALKDSSAPPYIKEIIRKIIKETPNE